MRSLDDLKAIEKIDKGGMRNILAEFPQQVRDAFRRGEEFSLVSGFTQVKNIVFSGMGGSAIGAELVSFYLRGELKLPVYVNREYSLPGFVDRESLVIFISYSGNTEETLSAYQQAQEKGAKIIVLTSGGQLADLAKAAGEPCLLVPGGFPPRAALAFLSFPVLAFFAQAGLIEDKQKQVEETISVLQELNKSSLGLKVGKELNPAKKLALRLLDNFCFIYAAGEYLSGVVTRWRGQLAENSKALSSSHVLPEMNHNEIVGWQHPQGLLKNFVPLFLRDKQEQTQVKKRMEISKEILQKQGLKVEEIWSRGMSLLARTFSLIYIGDFTSFYLAILNAEDPTPVKRIDYLKKRLKEI